MVGELAANEKALTQTGHEHRPLCRHVLHHEALGKEESLLLLLLYTSKKALPKSHWRTDASVAFALSVVKWH